MPFFETDAGKLAAIAKAYLEGASSLDDAQREKGRILFLPTLSLAGHGLEMMLKACWSLNGKNSEEVRKAGHNILKLWNDEVSEPLRATMYVNARMVAAIERDTGLYPDVPDCGDTQILIEEYVLALGNLHGRSPDFPLRYPSNQDQKAPRTTFLVRTLYRSADDLVKRPIEFELSYFKGTM